MIKQDKPEKEIFTACSKSPDIPIDSSHLGSGIPRALQTANRQSNRACSIQQHEV